MKNTKQGSLTIGRIHSNVAEDNGLIHIQLEDEASGIEFVHVYIKPEQLALALTGLSSQECEFKLVGVRNVGKRREVKQEVVSAAMVRPHKMTPEEIRAWLARYEVDGWQAQNDRDFGNHHRQVGDAYRVTFVRFVDVESAEAGEDSDG